MNATPTMMDKATRLGYPVEVIINGEHYTWKVRQ